MFNTHFLTDVVPSKLEIAKVIPLFKTKYPALFSNYRPISLLPVFSKILERLMYTRLYNLFTEHNVLSLNQFDFRNKHSTDGPRASPLGYHMTRKDVKGDQPSGGETTWTNTGATRYGRGQHKRGSFGDDILRLSPNHGTQRLPNDDDESTFSALMDVVDNI